MKQYEYSNLGKKMVIFSYIITVVSVISLSLHQALAGIYYVLGWFYLLFGLYLSKSSINKYFRNIFKN